MWNGTVNICFWLFSFPPNANNIALVCCEIWLCYGDFCVLLKLFQLFSQECRAPCPWSSLPSWLLFHYHIPMNMPHSFCLHPFRFHIVCSFPISRHLSRLGKWSQLGDGFRFPWRFVLLITALKVSSALYGHYFGLYVSSSPPTLSCLKISEHKVPLCARIARFSDHHFLVKIFIWHPKG